MKTPERMPENYPAGSAARDRWIRTRRPARNVLDPQRPYAFLMEQERAESGDVVSVATIFLTNRECPWRCVMCDLWKNTLTESVPAGAIPHQIDVALAALAKSGGPIAGQIKLYNSGSFFDPRAIPSGDHPAIAARLTSFERVIVECHPALVDETALRFRDRLAGRLEVAMGLETVHPQALPRLNKRMTLEQFRRAAEFLRAAEIAVRAFVLVQPPFVPATEAVDWATRSLEFAFDCGAGAVTLIPTRPGNGALEALAAAGEFAPPTLATLEAAFEQGLRLARGRGRGRVFADVWDLERFSHCAPCFSARRARMERMNLQQAIEPAVVCRACARASAARGGAA